MKEFATTTACHPPRLILVERAERPEPCGHCDARKFSVCNAIGERDLARLAALTTVVTIDPGQTFIAEGEPAGHFFNMTRGTAKLYKLLPDGRRQITGFGQTGDFLGLAVSSTYAFSAEAITPVRACRFSRRKLTSLLDDFPAMERRLLEVASNELVVAQAQMLLLGRKTARERVASFLLAQRERARACYEPLDTIDLPMTRGDIADYLGLTIETVSRTLTKFKKDGLIGLPNYSSVTLTDDEGLQELAEGNVA